MSSAGSNEQFRSIMNKVQLQIANLTNLVANMINGTAQRAESERSAIWALLPPPAVPAPTIPLLQPMTTKTLKKLGTLAPETLDNFIT
jgi:hypothetical protein